MTKNIADSKEMIEQQHKMWCNLHRILGDIMNRMNFGYPPRGKDYVRMYYGGELGELRASAVKIQNTIDSFWAMQLPDGESDRR